MKSAAESGKKSLRKLYTLERGTERKIIRISPRADIITSWVETSTCNSSSSTVFCPAGEFFYIWLASAVRQLVNRVGLLVFCFINITWDSITVKWEVMFFFQIFPNYFFSLSRLIKKFHFMFRSFYSNVGNEINKQKGRKIFSDKSKKWKRQGT